MTGSGPCHGTWPIEPVRPSLSRISNSHGRHPLAPRTERDNFGTLVACPTVNFNAALGLPTGVNERRITPAAVLYSLTWGTPRPPLSFPEPF